MTTSTSTRRSLALVQLHSQITKEIRSFWFQYNSLEYAEQFIRAQSNGQSVIICNIANMNTPIMRNLHITSEDYYDDRPDVEECIRQNAIINLITSLESYIQTSYARMLFLSDTILEKSDFSIQASSVFKHFTDDNPKLSLCLFVANTLLRNLSPRELIKKIAASAKSGIMNEMSDTIENFILYCYLRNSVVHNCRRITQDLSLKWVARYPQCGSLIKTEAKDVTKLSSICLRIAENIDRRVINTAIHNEDARLFARELFIRFGMDKRIISVNVNNILRTKLTSVELDKLISALKKGNIRTNDFIYSDDVFLNLVLQ